MIPKSNLIAVILLISTGAQAQQVLEEGSGIVGEIQELKSRIDGWRTERGTVEIKLDNEPTLAQEIPPTANKDEQSAHCANKRGVRAGRVQFSKPFPVAPNVVLAISRIDVSGGTNATTGHTGATLEHIPEVKVIQPFKVKETHTHQVRAHSHWDNTDSIRIDAQVAKVDKSGFDFKFFTWCRTQVFDARVEWLAVPTSF
ncbi:H-type lectin domain-containing protein [Ruegeria sp. HKCCD7318]|uniref:H-type lectin domain-containing protein n=1 Tax=Ruegeria sp. HKCCD7318 TaxID=2683014 RepID=UPI001491847F|nr:H-type lectin domain-containing protein [Ruegeria sp. HKCCD7318]NOE36231.1 hypothetical protein [Ruegeria sp. HKCCD7318]